MTRVAGLPRLSLATLLVVALFSPAQAQVTGPIPVTGTPRLVAGGEGAQTDPHVSGVLVSYTNRTSTAVKIHVFDLVSGASGVLGVVDTFLDSISDISGSVVVFTRRDTSTGSQFIVFVDLSNPTVVTELAPESTTGWPPLRRTSARIGGDTVAFQQFTTASSGVSAVCVADIDQPTADAICLTDESFSHSDPAVSPDGNVVTFQKCSSPDANCDIYAATRNGDGTWGTPTAITMGGGSDLSPDTNGSIVVYSADAVSAGDFDVYYEPVSGNATAARLELTDAPGSDEENPNISGSLITFERRLPGKTNADLYAFDINSNILYQLTSTPDIDEHLNDVSVLPDGTVHVVWAAVDPDLPLQSDNVYASSFSLTGQSFSVCPLFDTTRSYKAGRIVPIRLQLCDSTAANLSSNELTLTAVDLVHVDGTAGSAVVDSPGEANADSAFRYDDTLAGYVFNLSTRGLSRGTWELRFTVGGEAAVYAIQFDVR